MRLAALIIFLISAILFSTTVYTKKPFQEKPTNQFEIDILDAHNKYRAAHGVPPLKWSSKLQKLAQDWANYLAQKDIMRHRPDSGYGENIFYISNARKPDNKRAVQWWYDEIQDYDPKIEESKYKALHFSQVVWKDTKFVGAAMAKTAKGDTDYVVANYDPRGNYLDEYAENVLPVKKG